MSKVSEPRIETIFCDDIREEVGNKRSLMGIYHGEMFVHSMPILLPKLCFYITYITDISEAPIKLEIRVVKGVEEIELITTGEIQPDSKYEEPPNNNLGVPFKNRTMIMAFTLSPFTIEEETVVRVVVVTDSGKTYGPCLRIRNAEKQATA